METARRFRRIKNAEHNPELASLYAEIIESGLGNRVPLNWFTAQAERPDILAATWTLAKGILLHGQLPPTVKQMIAVKVSTYNRCRYCAAVHTSVLQAMGVPGEVIDRVTTDLNLAEVSPPQRAILQFAMKVARDPKSLTDGDFQNLQDLGLSDGETMEVAMMAAYTNFINLWADVSGIPLEGDEES
jgi:uncharacterized peroxidase-related enzyme